MNRVAVLCLSLMLATHDVAAQNPPRQVPELDQSGKGAVLCTWELVVALRNNLDLCFPGEYQPFRANLAEAIDAMNHFIVANNPTPVTKAELEATIARRAERERAKVAGASGSIAETDHCRTARKYLVEGKGMQTWSQEEFRHWFADFLSVPRRPVMNPCL